MVQELQRIVVDIPRASLEQWARDLDLSPLYDVPYRFYSNDVHSKPRSLERYLVTDRDGEYASFNWGPAIDEDLRAEFLESARLLIISLSFVKHVFGLDISSEINRLLGEYVRLESQSGHDGQQASGNSG
jgi:hypothetical protein